MKFEANTGSQAPGGEAYCVHCTYHQDFHWPSLACPSAETVEARAKALRDEAAAAQGVDFTTLHTDVAKQLAPNALDVQQGGDHYKKHRIQPIEYIHANGIPFAEGSVIKYVTRWRDKGGIKDLEKARHFLDLLIELETRGNAQPD
jgi:hypothetical protein